MRNPFRLRPVPSVQPATLRIGDAYYDRRSAALLDAFDQPSRWRSWAGAMRRMMAPGREEQRAITSLPWVPFNQGNLVWPFGGAQSSEDRALSLTPVYAAVQMIADDVSTLPVKTYRKGTDQRIPMPSLPQLFAQLDESGMLVDWLHRCMTSLLLWGNAYGLITSRDGMEFPTAVMWLDPAMVTCNETNPAAPVWYWQGRHIPSENLIHIPWFTVAGKVKGLSPIEAFATTMNVGLQAQDYTQGWFQAGGVPPGTFKNSQKTVNGEEAEVIKDRLVSAIRSRKPIVYGADWDYNPITIPPEQAQFVQTMKLTATQIASIYRMPPEMVGGETGVYTYNTVEQNTTYYVTHTLRPWLVRLETKLSAVLPLRQYVRFNADALIRVDLATRYAAHRTAREVGLNNIDELRALEDELPLPDGKGQDYTPLLVQVAASRGVDAAQVRTSQPLSDQPDGQPPASARGYDDVIDAEWDQFAIGGGGVGPKGLTVLQELIRRRYEPGSLGPTPTWDDDYELDEATEALIVALAELAGDGDATRAWDPAKHPRNPPGTPGGGRFRSLVDRLKDAIEAHLRGGGDGDPFTGFDREQLRRAAKARGIALSRGEDRDSIAQKLLDSLRGEAGIQEVPAAQAPARPRINRPPRPAPRQRAESAGRAATAISYFSEQLWRERNLAGRRRAAADIASAPWWRDDWDGAAELRDALGQYGRGHMSIEDLMRVLGDVETRHHLRREGTPGDRVRYDPVTMEPSTNFAEDGMRDLQPGDQAEVVAPGYLYTGGRVTSPAARTRVRPLSDVERPSQPRPPASPRPRRAVLMLNSETDVPSAGTMFDRARSAFSDDDAWGRVDPRPFQQILGGEIAGLRTYGMTVEYDRTLSGTDILQMSGRLERADGRDVGNFEVTFKRTEDGTITAYHDFLQLERAQQGSGFANEYGLRLLTWYRESGVNRMTLHANIDVGGYAWARMGFNWASVHDAVAIRERLDSLLVSPSALRLYGAPDVAEQVALGRDLLRRMQRARNANSYPTPYEISQLGRWPGAGRDDMWIGKALLLGSSWHGTLTLSEVENR